MVEIKYLRVILTSRCNMSCDFCHHEGVSTKSDELSTERLCELLYAFYKAGIRKFKLMGGEPTLRKDLPQIINYIYNIDNQLDISLISNGCCEQSLLDECLKNGLKRINISVHDWSVASKLKENKVFDKSTMVKKNMEWLSEKQKLSKVNYVYLNKSSNDEELFDLIEWIRLHNCVLDILNLLSLKKDKFFIDNFADFIDIERLIRSKYEVEYEYTKENHFSLPSKRLVLNGGGEINLKTTRLNSTYMLKMCKQCPVFERCTEGISAIRLTESGILRPCLFRDDNTLDLSNVSSSDLASSIHTYIQSL